jgi:PTS system mannose-specific IIC component
MNLRSINRPNTMLFFILGFVMSIYMGLDVIVIAVLGAIIAYLYTITPRNEIGGFS